MEKIFSNDKIKKNDEKRYSNDKFYFSWTGSKKKKTSKNVYLPILNQQIYILLNI